MTDTRNARFTLRVASGEPLDVRAFTVHERISALFRVSVTAVTTSADLDFEAIIGKDARFEIDAGLAGVLRSRVWSGVCSQVREIAVEEAGLSTYVIEIVPALWLAGQRRNHRMFQLLSDVDIVLKLLAEWGIEPTRKLSATYPKRKYRVQYGESDYAFMCRLLEDAGVSFSFSGESGETKLVLCDAPEAGEWGEHTSESVFSPDLAQNIWLGVSVESASYTWRVDHLRRVRASTCATDLPSSMSPGG